ncbi:hypothetical protein HUO13_22220 [Saccharopolyspora erythraea]|uniref:hypothetical protein n=1 Tax=Saccharopolyspora erythraea TaxID=1836 RepID=UPI001BA93783|nr:hypothetical protein [Saccharopolyspora erythraea]QUH03176.1 hypothetical protein HUO13_22220 [Saccharopolyspora erythraea]
MPSPQLRGDLVAFAAALCVIAAAAVTGHLLNRAGAPLFADSAPIFGFWSPHAGPGTLPALVTAVAVVVFGPALAERLSWPLLLAAGYAGSLCWTLFLALVEGWRDGIALRLTHEPEYLHDVPRVTDIPAMLSGFTDHILAFQPDSWTVHVSGHPPGVLLLYVWLDRIGLGGGTEAGVLSLLVGSLAAVAVAVTVRALAGGDAARAAVPFLVLFPGAVWVGVSADGVFMGVVATGVALFTLGATGRGVRADAAAVAGGVLLGWGIFLNYGLVLMAPFVIGVALLTRRVRPLVLGAAGAVAVVAAFAVAGFWWLDGYHLVVERYYQGEFALRPYSYWVWGNVGALLLSAGPVAAVIARRAAVTRTAVAVPVAAAAVAVLAADISGLSKAEVERIWLPFAVWFCAGAALLPRAHRRGWLAVQAVTALAVNHLVVTNW